MGVIASIILPVYNGQKYLNEMLDSIWKQSYRPIQLIISDDCSTDSSVSIIGDWRRGKQNDNFKIEVLYNKKNVGLSANISRAVLKAEGDYLFFADQDDIWDKNKIEKQIEYLCKNLDCVMCQCDRSIIDQDGNLLYRSENAILNHMVRKRDLKRVLQTPSIYAANCLCLRGNCINDIFPIPGEIVEQDSYIAAIAAHYGNIGYLFTPLVKYRIHDNNVSSPDYKQRGKKFNFIKFYSKCVRHMRRYNSIVTNDDKILRNVLLIRYQEDLSEYRKNIRKPIHGIYIQSIIKTFKQYIKEK